MAKIKVTSKCAVYDGMSITFKAPCDFTEVDGLKIGSQSFVFKDAGGNTLTPETGNLFSAGAYVTAVLDTGRGYAYLQNCEYAAGQVNVAVETATALGLSAGASVNDALRKMETSVQVEETQVQTAFIGVDWKKPSEWLDSSTSSGTYIFTEFAGRWYAFKYGGAVAEYIHYVSSDLKTWTKITIHQSYNANVMSVHVVGDRLIINANNGNTLCYYITAAQDPTNLNWWTYAGGPGFSANMANDDTYLYCWQSGAYSGLTLKVSTDGVSWTSKGTINRSDVEVFNGDAFCSDGKGTLFAVGVLQGSYPEYGAGYAYISHDWGATWNKTTANIGHDGSYNGLYRYVVYRDGYFYIFQEGSNQEYTVIRKTVDGKSYEQIQCPLKVDYRPHKAGDYWYGNGYQRSAPGSNMFETLLCRSADLENWESLGKLGSVAGNEYWGSNDILFSNYAYMTKNEYEYRYELMYPNGEINTDKVMRALGLPGAKVETGSYMGTNGTNPSLTFSFAPKIVILKPMYTQTWSNMPYMSVMMQGATYDYHVLFGINGVTNAQLTLTWSNDGHTVSWKSNYSDAIQHFNQSSIRYDYIAIG